MGRWRREEIEEAFDRYQAAALKGAQQGDWREWADMFTPDATYFEHQYGHFWGREAVYQWISKVMKSVPGMRAFPVEWYSIDKQKGWVICKVQNRMQDLGDGEIYQEPNITILHYAGDGKFSYEEDAYDRQRMSEMVMRWAKAKERLGTA